jgi:hypothetical protein
VNVTNPLQRWRPHHVVLPTGIVYDPRSAVPAHLFDDELFASLFGDPSLSHVQRVGDDAQVYGNAIVSGFAIVSGYAEVYGNAIVSGYAEVCDNARVYGNARVRGDAWVRGDEVVN